MDIEVILETINENAINVAQVSVDNDIFYLYSHFDKYYFSNEKGKGSSFDRDELVEFCHKTDKQSNVQFITFIDKKYLPFKLKV